LNLGIRSRSVNTVRWEQKASGWSLSSFSIYNHKTHTHTHWWLYNLIRIQYYTSDCNISTQIMDYIYIHDYICILCECMLFHIIPLYPILTYWFTTSWSAMNSSAWTHPGA
jgi:hypothetical protein